MTGLSKKQYAVLGLAGVLVASGVWYFHFRDPVLARVGDTRIRRSEALYRDQIIRLSFPEEKRSMGLYQLIKSAIHYEILKNHSIPFPNDVLQKEEERIEKNTRNPEQLKTIKDIFKETPEAYRSVFILPTLVDRVIYYDFFLNDEKIQASSVQPALDFLKQAQTSENGFRQAAIKKNLVPQKVLVSEKDGVQWKSLESSQDTVDKNTPKHSQKTGMTPSLESGDGDYNKWNELLVGLKPGQVAPMPINFGEAWLVLYYHNKPSPTSYELEVVSFPKLEYAKWFEAEKAKLNIVVYDKSLPTPK
ncbi:hypothetical protein [Bdellovibrio sp. HCB337]|uniref:hypothetical protein n=1 Tax=Bdellovibrio sp. HCB337 TaxID=3394358 RepID=UPI0039A6BD15